VSIKTKKLRGRIEVHDSCSGMGWGKEMKRILKLVSIVAIIALPMSFMYGVHAFLNTQVQSGQIYDGSLAAANYGVSTQYGYNAPANDTHPQFYSGLESHGGQGSPCNLCSSYTYGVYDLKITLSGTYPNGGAIPGNGFVFSGPSILYSPQSNGPLQPILSAIFVVLTNALPYGIGSDIQYAGAVANGGLTYGTASSNAWVDWNAGAIYAAPRDSGIDWGWQLAVDPTQQGTYSMTLTYQIEIEAINVGGSYIVPNVATVSETIYYCYVTCGTDFSLSSSSTFMSANPVQSALSTITVGSLNSFSGPVELSATASDSSLQLSLSPQIVSMPNGGTATSTLTVAVPSGTCKVGTFTVIVDADNGIDHPVSISVSESCPDFSISPNAPSICQFPGTADGAGFAIDSLNGFSGTVALSYSFTPTPGGQVSTWITHSSVSISPGVSGVSAIDDDAQYNAGGSFTATMMASYGSDSHSASVPWTISESCPIGGGGGGGSGGSVAGGTLITLADGRNIPVQDLKVGMRLLSYNMTSNQFVQTTITRFVTVNVYNKIVVHTADGRSLTTDQNPAQKLYVMLPNGTWTLLPVTELRVGYRLFNPITDKWVPITHIHYANQGTYVMYDIYTTAPGNYIANGYLDPLKT
jgi:hypothetical protein